MESWSSQSHRKWINSQEEIQRLKERPSRDGPTWRSIPYTVTKPDTIVEAKKCLLTGAWYSCLLRDSARGSKPTTGLSTDWKSWRGLQPHKKNNKSTNQTPRPTPPKFPGTNHQPKSTHGATHGSSRICSKGWPCQASLGEEALGPVKAWCPSVGDRTAKQEWLDLWARRGGRGGWRGNQERG